MEKKTTEELLKENPVEELKAAAIEAEKKGGAQTPEDVFAKIATRFIENNRPDLVEALGRGAAKVGDTGMLSASSLSGGAKAAIAAIGGLGKGFTEAMGDKDARNKDLLEQLKGFMPKQGDVYAERKENEMKVKILDKVSDRSSDYEKSDAYKNMSEAVISYNQLVSLVSEAAEGKGFSDIAILTKFMKSLDPRSVVRDTEFQTASNTGSLFQSLQNKIVGLVTGQRINEKQKQQILDAAQAVMGANAENFGNYRQKQIEKATQPLAFYKSIFPELDTEADRLFIDLGEGISTRKTEKEIKDEVVTYTSPQGNKTKEEMRQIYFIKNPQGTEAGYKTFLQNYSR